MEDLRILVVEDDLLLALDLEAIVVDLTGAAVIVAGSLDEARAAIAQSVHFAILDVDVIGGKTFGIAQDLATQGIPVVFASGSPRDLIPPDLQMLPFVAKPCERVVIETLLEQLRDGRRQEQSTSDDQR